MAALRARGRLLGAALATAALIGPGTLSAAAQASRATAAARMQVSDTAHLHFVRRERPMLFEQGSASGTLPGSMRASLHLGTSFSASFTISTRRGSLRGHATATPHGSGRYQSFAGSIMVSGGSGRYAHAHGHAALYGVFDLRTYALTVQTTGTVSY
jgi:hypothetical protein